MTANTMVVSEVTEDTPGDDKIGRHLFCFVYRVANAKAAAKERLLRAKEAAAAEKERPAIVTATAWNANARADGRVAVAIGRAGRWTRPRCRQRHGK